MRDTREYRELCADNKARDYYGFRRRDEYRLPSSRPNSIAVINLQKICKDCPVVADCYKVGRKYTEQGKKIIGVYGGFHVNEIAKHVKGDRLGHDVSGTILERLVKVQEANREEFPETMRKINEKFDS